MSIHQKESGTGNRYGTDHTVMCGNNDVLAEKIRSGRI